MLLRNILLSTLLFLVTNISNAYADIYRFTPALFDPTLAGSFSYDTYTQEFSDINLQLKGLTQFSDVPTINSNSIVFSSGDYELGLNPFNISNAISYVDLYFGYGFTTAAYPRLYYYASNGSVIYNNLVVIFNVTKSESVIAVPEPETYSMLLAGIGLIGFIVKKKKTST